MSIVDKLENLECLKNGLHKKWIWNDADSFSLSCDYLQKINYCIQDLNSEIGSLSNPSMKEVIFVIVLVDWICEAVDCLPKLLIPDLRDGFSCEYESELEKAKKYFKAIRSFVVAHPLKFFINKQYLYLYIMTISTNKGSQMTEQNNFTHRKNLYPSPGRLLT